MNKVIKAFKKLNSWDQNELYLQYSEGELERTVFPYNGVLVDGVIYKTDDSEYASGAALAVYRGHTPNTPIWSVAFAPCGYYFASAGADATGQR